jgi:glycosyltransferase involved in cell wall biosynthesis
MNQMETKSFTVSAVIPAYNAAEYLGRTIDSVLAQSRTADEIIIVDDGSTDNTADVASAYGEKVKYIHQENAGASAARNTGINAASCEWIAFLDGDDEWYPQKLQVQMELLKRNPHLEWATANFDRCLCGENQRGPDIIVAKASNLLAGKDYFDSYFAASMSGASWCTDTMIIKRHLLEKAGLFREGQVRANDLDMWWRIAHRWPQIGYWPEPLAVYHMGTPDSISQGSFDKELHCELLERHLKLADQAGSIDNFTPFATWTIRKWLRAMLFYEAIGDIRGIMHQFKYLLPKSYQMLMGLLTTFPRITANGCHLLSRINNKLGLRKKIVRRPKR